jgi:hypothetical protein
MIKDAIANLFLHTEGGSSQKDFRHFDFAEMSAPTAKEIPVKALLVLTSVSVEKVPELMLVS